MTAPGPWGRLVALLDRRETGEALALYRVACGLVVTYAVATVWWPGLVEVIWLDAEHGGYRDLPRGSSWLVGLLGGPAPEVVWPLVYGTVAAGVLLTLGVASRLMALLSLQGFMALAWIDSHAGGSYDTLLTNALWLLVLARSDATLSLWCRLRTGRWTSDALVTSWPRWLVVLQLVVMYTSTGLQKVSAYWVPGGDFSALYYILQQPSWARADMAWVAPLFPLTQVATAAVWLFEVGAPLLLLALWYRHTRDRPGRMRRAMNHVDFRALFAAFGVTMHLGIHATMVVGPFSLAAIAFYTCLWHPDELRRAARRLRGRRALNPAGARTAPAPPSPPGTPARRGA